MISHLNLAISREINDAVKGLPLYQGGPGVDYSQAPVAYAANTTLVHIPERDPRSDLHSTISPATRVLLVQRAAGDGVIGSWSGVSGYVDVVSDNESFDPIAYTVRTELMEECNLSPELVASLQLYLGERFSVRSYHGGILHVLPVLGVYPGAKPPPIVVNPVELSDHTWVRLGFIQEVSGIDLEYLYNTLPRALYSARQIRV